MDEPLALRDHLEQGRCAEALILLGALKRDALDCLRDPTLGG